MKGFMYILLCSDGSYYTGSTIDLKKELMNTKMETEQITQKKGYQLN